MDLYSGKLYVFKRNGCVGLKDYMDPIKLSTKVIRRQLSFFVRIWEYVKNLDDKIRVASMFLSYQKILS